MYIFKENTVRLMVLKKSLSILREHRLIFEFDFELLINREMNDLIKKQVLEKKEQYDIKINKPERVK